MYKMRVSTTKPLPVRADPYADMVGGPQFRSGMRVVSNPKPNRNPITVRFMAEAVVPFPFTGTARQSLDRKGRIPTPVIHPHASAKATWVAESN